MATLTKRFVTLGSGMALLAILSGCSKTTSPTPAATLSTEDKSGTVNVGGNDTKTFTVNYAYTNTDAEVTLKSVTSVATGANLAITLGVGFGTPAFDGSCSRSPTYTANAAVIGQAYNTNGSAPFGPGPYCVSVFDAGTLTEPVNYTLTIKHY